MTQFTLIWWRFKISNSCPSSSASPFFCPKLPIRLISTSRIPPSLESAFSLPRTLSAHPRPQVFTASAALWYFIPKTGLAGEPHGAQRCPDASFAPPTPGFSGSPTAARTRNLVTFPTSSASSHLRSVPKSWGSCLSRRIHTRAALDHRLPFQYGPLRTPWLHTLCALHLRLTLSTPSSPLYTTTSVVFKLTKPCPCLKPSISPGTKAPVLRMALESCSLWPLTILLASSSPIPTELEMRSRTDYINRIPDRAVFFVFWILFDKESSVTFSANSVMLSTNQVSGSRGKKKQPWRWLNWGPSSDAPTGPFILTAFFQSMCVGNTSSSSRARNCPWF